MSNKIKILHIVPGLDAGGISILLLNYYKLLDREKIHFDFAIYAPQIGYTGQQFINLGSNIYHLTPKRKSVKAFTKELKEIITNGQYDIIHAHQNYMSFFPLFIAKRCGIKIRIAHGHTAAVVENTLEHHILKRIGCFLTKIVATNLLACGKKAGDFLWNKNNYLVMKNAINIEDFKFDEEKRHNKRTELMLENNFVYGTVGRCSKEKNQLFLIELHEKLIHKIPNAKLIIVGNGELEEELKKRISQSENKDSIIFLGKREDVAEILLAFDVFVLPSISEGNPTSGIEAISTGAPCIFSKSITRELELTDYVKYADLKNSEEWLNILLEFFNLKNDREKGTIIMSNEGYDIKDSAAWLEKYYENCIRGTN